MPDRARPDSNNQYSLIAVSNADGVTPVSLWADPTTHSILTSIGGASSGDGAILDGAVATTKATVKAYTNANPLTVRLSDTNGDYVSAGAGTQYTNGAVTPANPVGTIPVYDNAGTIASVGTTNRLPVSATQSGTWNITNVSGTVSLPTGASTAAKQPALGTAGTASADVITVQGVASMTALKVDGSGVTQPVSGTFWQATQPVSGTVSITANSSVNVAQLAGTTTDTNSGVKSAGTLRVVLATDQPALTNALKVDGSAVTQPVSGTITANAGTGTFTVAGAKTNNNAAPGATNVGALVGLANAAAPSWTEGNLVALSTDLAGNLRVTGSLSVGGTTDNSAYTAGTSTGTPAMGFYHSTIDAVTDGRAATLAIDAKRNLFTVLRDAAGNARGVNVTAGNALTVDGSGVTQPVSGTVTANIGTTNGLALDTSVNGLLLAQASTTSGQTGPLVQTATTTNAPTYTTAKTNPLSTDTSGLLRVSLKDTPANTTALKVDGSAVTQPVSGTVTANAGTNLNTSALALDATLAKLTITQGTALGTNTVALAGGSVTTNAPTFTTGQINQLSLTTAGGLRIDLKDTAANTNNLNVNLAASAATVTVSATNLSTNIAQVNGATTAGNTGNATNGTLRVVLATDQPQLTNALKVDGSAVTQPVSGTVTVNGNKTNNNAAPGATNLGVLPAIANAAAQSWTEGNQVALSTDLAGALRVTGSLSIGGTTDNSAYTAGSSTGTPAFGLYHSTIDAVTDGRTAAFAITANRAEHVNLRSAGGTELGVPSNPLIVQASLETVGGSDVQTTAPGVQLVSLGGPLGDPLDTVGNSLSVALRGTSQVQFSTRAQKGDAYLTLTSSTTETTLISALPSTYIDVYSVVAINTSASATQLDFRDLTGGSVRFSLYLPAGDTRGFSLTESAAWKQTAANNNWTAKCGTSVASVIISVQYLRNTV